MVTWLAYCNHGLESEFEALGWTIHHKALDGTHHGAWSHVASIELPEGDKPKFPERRSSDDARRMFGASG